MIAGLDIRLSLSGTPVLHGVSLNLEPGQVVALCGPNGAGKSTLLSCLAGEHPACADSIRYFGRPLTEMPTAMQARYRVVLEQSPTLSTEFTLSELIELGVPIDLLEERLKTLKAQALADFGFEDMEAHFVSALSGGQRHRAHLARVLTQLRANRELGHDCYLFLDEPTASLDIGYQIALLRLVRTLAHEGVGVLVVLHDLNLAAAFADQVILLKGGRVVQAGSPDDVLRALTLSEIYEVPILVTQNDLGQVVIQPVL